MKEIVIAKVEGGYVVRVRDRVIVVTKLSQVFNFVKEQFEDKDPTEANASA